jgi:hypothetical protein
LKAYLVTSITDSIVTNIATWLEECSGNQI